VIAEHNRDLDVWTGFAPDFLALMKAELGFDYTLLDADDVCTRELVEAYRAYLSNPFGIACSNVSAFAADGCCFTAEQHYTDDAYLFRWDATMTWDSVSQVIAADKATIAALRNPWMIEHQQQLNYSLGFQYVHKVGGKRGKVVNAELKLHQGLGGDVRGMPPLSGYTVVENAHAGTALPLTPIYSELSDTLVYTTMAPENFWGLFSPFSLELWLSIVGIVSLPLRLSNNEAKTDAITLRACRWSSWLSSSGSR
jgi:hypothetical protein